MGRSGRLPLQAAPPGKERAQFPQDSFSASRSSLAGNHPPCQEDARLIFRHVRQTVLSKLVMSSGGPNTSLHPLPSSDPHKHAAFKNQH